MSDDRFPQASIRGHLDMIEDYIALIRHKLDEPEQTSAWTLREAVNYFAATNVKLSAADLKHVVDYMHVYADQLEGSE